MVKILSAISFNTINAVDQKMYMRGAFKMIDDQIMPNQRRKVRGLRP